ncbi:MAG: hypothetical protein Kilf2KO_02380 [Rhodospirillales bacterium]
MNESLIHNNLDKDPQARRRGPKRDRRKLIAIAEAARQVLTAQGPRLTQVADVAKTAGVAAGTVYVYVAEKEALIELALLTAARFDLPEGDRPVPFSAARLEAVASEALARRLRWPVLQEALGSPPTAETLRGLLAEAYDLLNRERLLIALLDRCARETAVLEALWFAGARHRFFDDFETALRRLAEAGLLRRDIDLAAAARATLEMLVWMAMRRTGDPEPPRCDEAEARRAAIALATGGLAARAA